MTEKGKKEKESGEMRTRVCGELIQIRMVCERKSAHRGGSTIIKQ